MSLTSLLIFTLFIFYTAPSQAKCVPARQYIDMPKSIQFGGGQYSRVHPSGQYMLLSNINRDLLAMTSHAGLVRITNGKAELLPTPLNDEVAPVQGDWSLLASPNHQDGMHYYRLSDIIKKGEKAKPVFKDPSHNQYYHSSANLKGSSKSKVKLATMLITTRKGYRTYEFDLSSSGKISHLKVGPRQSLCPEGVAGSKTSPTSFPQPILSTDAREFASLHEGTTKIFKVSTHGKCKMIRDLGYATGKVTFSPKKKGQKGRLTFNGPNGKAKLYDRDKNLTINLTKDGSSSYSSYPGFLNDGRVMVQVRRNMKYQILIADPNQIEPKLGGKCVELTTTSHDNVVEQ